MAQPFLGGSDDFAQRALPYYSIRSHNHRCYPFPEIPGGEGIANEQFDCDLPHRTRYGILNEGGWRSNVKFNELVRLLEKAGFSMTPI